MADYRVEKYALKWSPTARKGELSLVIEGGESKQLPVQGDEALVILKILESGHSVWWDDVTDTIDTRWIEVSS